MTRTLDLQSLKERLRKESPVHKAGGTQLEAAVAIIINPRDRGGSILLIKRTERQGDPWSGQIAFPGGHKTPSDLDFLETSIREAREEVGIDLREHELLGQLPLEYGRPRRVRVIPYVFQLRGDVIVRLNEEVAENFWVPLSVLALSETSKIIIPTEDEKLQVDAYIYSGNVVWGLTFRIINTLLDRKN